MVNYASITAAIANANRPRIAALKEERPDLGQVISGGLSTYYNLKGKQNAFDEQDRIKGLENNLSEAIASGDENAINNAYAQLNPSGYMEYLNKIKANREASDLEFQRQKELLDIQNKNAMGLAKMRASLESQQMTSAARNYEYLISKGVPEEEARKLSFAQGGVNVNVNPFEKKRIENIAKNIDENISASQSRIDDYNRMEQLLNNENVSTGGVSGAIKKQLPTALLNDETQELQSIINKIVPQMRPAGSGSTSDKDMAIFEKATVGLDKNKDANLNIVRGRRAVDENAIAREELRADWINQGGSLTEFDKQWRNYLNSNPIFSDDSGKLNQNRINAYDWFGGKRNSAKQENIDPLGIL